MAFWWDHGCFARRFQEFDHPLIRIERLVREQYLRLHVRQERIRSDQIMDLARGQDDLQRIAQRVRQHVKFAAQPLINPLISWLSLSRAKRIKTPAALFE